MRVACLALFLVLVPLSVSAQVTGDGAKEPTHDGLEGAHTDVNERAESADLTLRAALEAYETGDLARAEALLTEVHELEPSARTLRGLGIVAYRQARYSEAVGYLERSLAHPIKPLTTSLETGVRELLFDAVQRIGTLELAVVPEDARIVVDNIIPPRGASGVLLLTPGAHELELSAPEHEGVKFGISASAGVKQSMRVALRVLPRPDSSGTDPVISTLPTVQSVTIDPSVAPVVRDHREPSERVMRLKRTSYVMLALSGVALVTAGAVAVRAHAKVGAIEEDCRNKPDGLCELSEVRERERSANIPVLGKLATVSLITAGASGVAS